MQVSEDLNCELMEEATRWRSTRVGAHGAVHQRTDAQEKTEAVVTLRAEIDELEASIAQWTEQITELTKAVAALNAVVAKATSIREDSQDAQTAAAQAWSVLKDFFCQDS